MLSDAKAIVNKEMSGKIQLWYLTTLHAVSVSVTQNIDSYNNTSQNTSYKVLNIFHLTQIF